MTTKTHCSHGRSYKEQCAECELEFWQKIERESRDMLLRAQIRIAEAKKKVRRRKEIKGKA